MSNRSRSPRSRSSGSQNLSRSRSGSQQGTGSNENSAHSSGEERIARNMETSPTRNIRLSPERRNRVREARDYVLRTRNFPSLTTNNDVITYLLNDIPFRLEGLTKLNLQNINLHVLPEWFGDIGNNLKYLNLADNHLTRLPESIGNFTQLEELVLNNNPITYIPRTITNLPLRRLNVQTDIILERNGLFYDIGMRTWSIYNTQTESYEPNTTTYHPWTPVPDVQANTQWYNRGESSRQSETPVHLEMPPRIPQNDSPRSRPRNASTSSSSTDADSGIVMFSSRSRTPSSSSSGSFNTNSSNSPRSSSPKRQRKSAEKSVEQSYDISCMNEEDTYFLDDFTRGKDEYMEDNRVIILNEGKSKEGTCYGRTTLLKQLFSIEMYGPYPDNTERFFKLGTQYWVDYKAVKLILHGWKVLRLKRLTDVKIGSEFGVSRIHGSISPIYTLYKPNTKYQGKNEPTIEITMNSRHKVVDEKHVYQTPTTAIIEPVAISATSQTVSFFT